MTFLAPRYAASVFDVSNNPVDVSTALFNSPNISHMMDNVAASMSNAVRLLASPNVGKNNNTVPTSRSGTVWVTTTVVRVYWPWITLPALVVSSSVIVLLLSIWAAERDRAPLGGRNVPLWKQSNVGILNHGYDLKDLMVGQDVQTAALLNAESREEVKNWARNTQVQLMRDHEGHLRFRAVETVKPI